jgi:HEAT repeat protein
MTRTRRTLLLGALGAIILSAGCADLLDPSLPTPRERAQRDMKTLQTSRDPRERASAARGLGSVKAPEAVPVLIAALRDPDAGVRSNAADALAEMPDAAAQSLPALRAALVRETAGPVRVDTGWALKKLKAEPAEWVPVFRASLKDPDTHTRYNAAIGLLGRGDPVEIFPVFFDELGTPFGKGTSQQPYWMVRRVVESNDPRLVPLLLDGLQNGNDEQRAAAAVNLGGFKPLPVGQIARPLIVALRDPDPTVRGNAVTSLMRIGYEPRQGALVGPPLVDVLRDPDPRVRRAAAGAFRSMSQAPRSAIAGLVRLLRDPDPEVRAEAAFGLMGFLPPAREAVPALVTAYAQETEKKVKVSIAHALGSVRGGARDAVPLLRAALRDPDAEIRDAASSALQLIERE